MEVAVSTKEAVTRSFSDVVAVRGAVAVFVVLTLLLIVVVIAYLVWRMNRSQLTSTKVLSNPTRLNNNKIAPFSASNLPALGTGQPFSISFWLYLTDFKNTTNAKLVLWRNPSNMASGGATSFTSANPIVFLDPTANTMYVSIKTTRAIPAATPVSSLSQLITKSTGTSPSTNAYTYLTAQIDYVPLQRWVNYTFTVQDNLLSLYQDGSLYTTATLFDMIDPSCTAGTGCTARPLFAGVNGDMTIGNPTTCTGPLTTSTNNATCIDDVNGFIARVQFFNYALTSRQVQGVYYSGPGSGNMLRILGLPEYGLQSPIYRIDNVGNNDGNSGDATQWGDYTGNN